MVQRNLSRRRLLAGAAGLGAAGLGLSTAGCTGTARGALGDGRANLTVWTWPDNDRVFNEKTLPLFHEQHPDIRVKVEGFGGKFYVPKLLSAMVSGTGPDVAMVEISWISKFAAKPGWVDLSKAPFNAGSFKKDVAPFSYAYVENPETGYTPLLPKNTGPGGMFYRRDLFEKAGLPVEPDQVHAAMKTWDDYFEVGTKLAGKGQWLFDSPGFVLAAIRGQHGDSYFDKDGNSILDSDLMVSSMELIPQMQKKGLLAPKMTEAERGPAIGGGKIATFFSGNWFGGLLKGQYDPKGKDHWGVTKAPASPNGVSAFNYGGDFIGVLATSQNQQAAWTYVKWVTQNSTSLAAMFGQDLYPAWLPATKEKWIDKPDPYFSNQVTNDVFREVSLEMKTPHTNEYDGIAIEALNAAIDNVHAGVQSPKEALKAAKAEVEWKMG